MVKALQERQLVSKTSANLVEEPEKDRMAVLTDKAEK